MVFIVSITKYIRERKRLLRDFEKIANAILVDTFNYILRFEEKAVRAITGVAITIGETHVIEAIGKLGGSASVSDVANLLEISMPTATVALKKLERKGFIKRLTSRDDARKSIVELAESGQVVDRTHELFHRKMVREISKGFTEEEKAVLLTALQKLRDFFHNKL